MENQETELFRKCPEISLKIHSFDFGNGMYGNVTSLEHKKSIKNKNYDPFLNGFRDEKKYRLIVNIHLLMLYPISIRVRLRVRNRTFDGCNFTIV